MGGTPYPSVQPADLEAYLDSGNRMEQPDHCPPILYAIMLECFRKLPDERPTFSQLRESIRVLLEEVTYDYAYLSLNQARDYYNIITSDYPVVSFQHSSPTPDNIINATVTQNDTPSTNDDQSVSISEDLNSRVQSEFLHSPPGTCLTHRDSTGSDQLLMTPTTPKFKFFKFKPSATNHLETLPETGSASTESADKSGTDKSFTNAVHSQDLLPEKAKDISV